MRFKEYSNFSHLLDDIQFALGIALANVNEIEAARQVILFASVKKLKSEGRTVSDVIRIRNAIGAQLDRSAREQGVDAVTAFISYLWDTAVFDRIGGSKVCRSSGKCSLRQLLRVTTQKACYEKTMHLLMRTDSDHMIYAYMFTPLYFISFKNTVNQIVRKNYSSARVFSRGLSENDYFAILTDYSREIQKNSCNGTYRPYTGDPDAFLCSDPLRVWYLSAKENEFINIIHGQGQDTAVEDGDGTSYLELKGIRDEKTAAQIDFSRTCAEIYEASSLLFSHRGTVFYDIFSFARDKQLVFVQDELLKEAPSILPGISVQTTELHFDSVGGDYNTIMNKFHGRKQVCSLVYDAFAGSILIEDLEMLYHRILAETESLSYKNGQRLFRTADSNTKHVLSNGKMFQKLIAGFQALFRLIRFIESGSNKTGATVASFPVMIFRDRRYLKRFHDFESYVKNVKIVQEMITEVDRDAQRSVSVDAGIMSNDVVYDFIVSNSIRLDGIFSELGKKPLRFFQASIDSLAVSDAETTLHLFLDKMRSDILSGRCGMSMEFINDGLGEMKYLQLIQKGNYIGASLDSAYHRIMSGSAGEAELKKYQRFEAYAMASEYLTILRLLLEMEGTPIVDQNDCFLCTKDPTEFVTSAILGKLAASLSNYKKETDPARKESYQAVIQMLNLNRSCRMTGLCFIYGLFFNVDLAAEGKEKLTGLELHSLFYVGDMIASYFRHLGRVFAAMHPLYNKEDSFLTLVSLVKGRELFSLPDILADVSDIGFLYDSGCHTYIYRELLYSGRPDNAKIVSRHCSAQLLGAFSLMFGRISREKSRLNQLAELIDTKFSMFDTKIVYADNDLTRLLSQANISILGSSRGSGSAAIAANKLGAVVGKFDQMNYARSGGQLMLVSSGTINTYFHKNGYSVHADTLNNSYSIHVITEPELETLKRIYRL